MTVTEMLRMCCYIECGAPELCFDSAAAMFRDWEHYHARRIAFGQVRVVSAIYGTALCMLSGSAILAPESRT